MGKYYKTIKSITHMPMSSNNACYAFDLDDTVFRSHPVEIPTPEAFQVEPGEWHIQNLHHRDNAKFIRALSKMATVIIITARSPSEETVTELEDFGIPYEDLFFSRNKGPTLSTYTKKRNFEEIYFADDLDENLRSVRKHVPEAYLYKVV
jgi:hypothetical protein